MAFAISKGYNFQLFNFQMLLEALCGLNQNSFLWFYLAFSSESAFYHIFGSWDKRHPVLLVFFSPASPSCLTLKPAIKFCPCLLVLLTVVVKSSRRSKRYRN